MTNSPDLLLQSGLLSLGSSSGLEPVAAGALHGLQLPSCHSPVWATSADLLYNKSIGSKWTACPTMALSTGCRVYLEYLLPPHDDLSGCRFASLPFSDSPLSATSTQNFFPFFIVFFQSTSSIAHGSALAAVGPFWICHETVVGLCSQRPPLQCSSYQNLDRYIQYNNTRAKLTFWNVFMKICCLMKTYCSWHKILLYKSLMNFKHITISESPKHTETLCLLNWSQFQIVLSF